MRQDAPAISLIEQMCYQQPTEGQTVGPLKDVNRQFSIQAAQTNGTTDGQSLLFRWPDVSKKDTNKTEEAKEKDSCNCGKLEQDDKK